MNLKVTSKRPRGLVAAAVWMSCLALPALALAAGSATSGKIPRTRDGKPDFSGIWQTTSAADYGLEPHADRTDAPPGPGVIEGDFIPYTAQALATKARNFSRRDKNDPRLSCCTLGTPRGIYYPEPFQIFQRPQDVTLVFEFGDSVRTIHTDGTLHPKQTDNEFWLGDSRGHWEGDTLVVDVRDFNDQTWLSRAGDFHDEALHVVERWKYVDANTIDYQATLDDPGIYTRPWTLEVYLYRHREKNFQLIENYCYTLKYADYYPYPAEDGPRSPAASAPKQP